MRRFVLSFDSLVANAGGVVTQPGLGKAADTWGYPSLYVVGAFLQFLLVPFILLARREHAPSERHGMLANR